MRYLAVFIILSAFLPLISAAQDLPVSDPEVVHPNLRVTVDNMPLLKASDQGKIAVAKAAVDMVLGASQIKCDSGSQLNTIIEANASSSLRALSGKIGGSSCASNGHAMRLNAVFTPNGEIRADDIVAAILHQRPLLMEWNGILYVIHGVIYDEHLHNSGKRENVIRQLLLIDPCYSDQRRFVSFDRQRDDFAQIEGIAEIRISAP